MSKEKLKIEDLPTIEEFERKQANQLILLSKKFPDAEDILMQKISMTQSFLLQNYGLMELKDRNLAMGSVKKMFQYGFFSFVVPVVINIGLGPWTKYYFYELPKPLRVSIRLGLFLLPMYYCGMKNKEIYERVNWYLLDKYMDRTEIYMKFGDPKIMNPNFEDEQEN